MIKGKSETEIDDLLYAEGVRVIKSHPGWYAFLLFRKVFQLWLNLWYGVPPSKQSLAVAAYNLVLWILAIAGYRRSENVFLKMLMVAGIAYFTLLHVATWASARYAVPMYAYMTPFAALGVYSWLNRRSPSGGSRRIGDA